MDLNVLLIVTSIILIVLALLYWQTRPKETFIADDSGHPLYLNDEHYAPEVVYHDLRLPVVAPGDPYISRVSGV